MRKKHRIPWRKSAMVAVTLPLLGACLPDDFLAARLSEVSVLVADSLLRGLFTSLLDALPIP